MTRHIPDNLELERTAPRDHERMSRREMESCLRQRHLRAAAQFQCYAAGVDLWERHEGSFR